MNTFPLEFSKHIMFCIIGGVFFLFQYYRQGFKYQLISAASIAGTLLLYINDSETWRYIVGIIELLLIILVFITMSKEKKKTENQAQLAEGDDNVNEQ